MKKIMLIGGPRRFVPMGGLNVPSAGKERINNVVDDLRTWLNDPARSGPAAKVVGVDLSNRFDLSKVKADLIIVLGGDGSILATARRLKHNRIPVVGVNLGKFGFLAEYSLSELKDSFQEVVGTKRLVSSLMMLSCEVARGAKKNLPFVALNDMVITRGSISRMVYFRLYLDGRPITVFGADGVIISTPVGSTAYSLSAGGPIVAPDMQALIINPICAHTLSMRPLVVPAHSIIELEVADGGGQEITLTVDGQISTYMHPTDRLVFKKAHSTFQLVRSAQRIFYETLREKLLWGGQPHSQRYEKK